MTNAIISGTGYGSNQKKSSQVLNIFFPSACNIKKKNQDTTTFLKSLARLASRSRPLTSADSVKRVSCLSCGYVLAAYALLYHDYKHAQFNPLIHPSTCRNIQLLSAGKKTNTLGRTGGYAKAIPDITAALQRGETEGLPLFLMGHSYVSPKSTEKKRERFACALPSAGVPP